MAAGIAGNVVEQHRGVAHLAHVKIDNAADFRFPLGAADILQLACRAQRIDQRSDLFEPVRPLSARDVTRRDRGVTERIERLNQTDLAGATMELTV